MAKKLCSLKLTGITDLRFDWQGVHALLAPVCPARVESVENFPACTTCVAQTCVLEEYTDFGSARLYGFADGKR